MALPVSARATDHPAAQLSEAGVNPAATADRRSPSYQLHVALIGSSALARPARGLAHNQVTGAPTSCETDSLAALRHQRQRSRAISSRLSAPAGDACTVAPSECQGWSRSSPGGDDAPMLRRRSRRVPRTRPRSLPACPDARLPTLGYSTLMRPALKMARVNALKYQLSPTVNTVGLTASDTGDRVTVDGQPVVQVDCLPARPQFKCSEPSLAQIFVRLKAPELTEVWVVVPALSGEEVSGIDVAAAELVVAARFRVDPGNAPILPGERTDPGTELPRQRCTCSPPHHRTCRYSPGTRHRSRKSRTP